MSLSRYPKKLTTKCSTKYTIAVSSNNEIGNDTMVDIPTAYYTYIQGYETKTIIIPFYPNIKKIKVIPKIEGQVYLCTNEAPEVENIKDCEINVGGS